MVKTLVVLIVLLSMLGIVRRRPHSPGAGSAEGPERGHSDQSSAASILRGQRVAVRQRSTPNRNRTATGGSQSPEPRMIVT